MNEWKTLLNFAFSENCGNKYAVDRKLIQNIRSPLGSSVLHYAVLGQNAEALHSLLQQTDQISISNDLNETPLHWACRLGDSFIVSLLLIHGADVDYPDLENNTPMHWAAEEGHENVLRILKKAGADPNFRNNENQTPKELLEMNLKCSNMFRNRLPF